MSLTGPYWTNNEPVEAGMEMGPQEALFYASLPPGKGRTLEITAQNYYQIWFNGEWLGYGPGRAPHGHLTVDTIYLPDGVPGVSDILAIQVLWEGLFLYSNVRGTPSLWLSVTDPSGDVPLTVFSTPHTGRSFTHRFSRQRGWGEEVDARNRPMSWPMVDVSDSFWKPAVIRSVDPPLTLSPRDIEPLSNVVRKAVQVTFAGACDPSQRVTHRSLADDSAAGDEPGSGVPARLLQEERILATTATDRNLAALTSSGSGMAIIAPDIRGYDRTLQLDFEREVSGLLEISLTAPAGTVVDIGWSEGLWDDDRMNCWARSSQGGGSVAPRELCDSRQAVRFTCAGNGIDHFTSLIIAAFRHVRIAFRLPAGVNEQIIVHSFFARNIGYPIAAEGTFTCADEDLNRIYRASVETMENSIADAYLDCPGRERGAWLNDSYWAADGHNAVTGDWRFERRFLTQFFVSQTEMPFDGLAGPLYPSESHLWRSEFGGGQSTIVGHVLFWLLQLARHIRRHGDDALAAEWRDQIDRALAGFAKCRSSEGLLESTPWDHFVDWSRYATGPIQVIDNLLYAHALSELGELYADETLVRDAAVTRAAVASAAWDDARELYSDVIVRDGNALRAGSEFSATTNYIALWTSVGTPESEARVWHRIRNFHPMTVDRALSTYETNFVRANIYGVLYRFDYEGRVGDTSGLIRDIKEAYLPQLERGQTSLSEHLGFECSLCHGFNAYVARILSRGIGGIDLPAKQGDVIRIIPQPSALSWAQARVPWCGGYVSAWWARTGSQVIVRASVPPGQRGVIELFGQSVPFDGAIDIEITQTFAR
ncbi:MAG TPA: hypothetical protein VGK19_13805 [Capsulimonadaceae bacterium]|jgi:alpha-L-rhamnosidase